MSFVVIIFTELGGEDRAEGEHILEIANTYLPKGSAKTNGHYGFNGGLAAPCQLQALLKTISI